MDFMKIGRTDVNVSRVSFGCASIGNLYRKVSDTDAQAILNVAWQRGIRYFDTAPFYGRGLAEQRLAQFLKSKQRDDYVISTKVGRLLSPGAHIAEADGFIEPLANNVSFDYTGEGITNSFEQSCQRLGVDKIDILYVHDLGRFTHGADHQRYMDQFLSSGYDALVKLKKSRKISAFGLGVNENQVCLDVMAYGPIDVILLAGRLTLLDRSAEQELVPHCLKSNTSLVLGGIFNSGILATGATEGATFDYQPASEDIIKQVKALEAKAAENGITLAGAAMRYAYDHRAVSSVLFGTAKMSSLERNLTMLTETTTDSIQTF